MCPLVTFQQSPFEIDRKFRTFELERRPLRMASILPRSLTLDQSFDLTSCIVGVVFGSLTVLAGVGLFNRRRQQCIVTFSTQSHTEKTNEEHPATKLSTANHPREDIESPVPRDDASSAGNRFLRSGPAPRQCTSSSMCPGLST